MMDDGDRMMDIVIPTRGRWDLVLTCDKLPKELRDRIYVVCPEGETRRHADTRPWAKVVVQPDKDMTIAAKRAWILREWKISDKIVMLDDDLRFFVKKDNPTKLRPAARDDLIYWFDMLGGALTESHPMAGFGSRLFNNVKPPGWQYAKRMQYVLGFYLPVVRRVCDLSGRIETREDMDYALQLLRGGYSNALCHTIAVEQSNQYAARGGCAGQRTTASSDADADRLAALHPGLVRVVQKKYKGHPRREVVVRWEAALREGKERLQNEPRGREAGSKVRDSARVSRSSRERRK